ncbi:MAG: 3-oxoacyl-[acyl-carrier-protein] reductase [Eubacteriales bacterium]|nr:3-oxoacyl-[acyl-carrier-protein] reductase [Eubacteriales bacterium]
MSKLAIVTGASRGIGAAIARQLAAEGCDVVINCVSSVEKAEAVAAECRAMGGKAYPMAWDVADYEACKQAVQQIQDEIGTPEILVNNAGITQDGLLIRMKPEQFDRVIQACLHGTFHMTSLVGAKMLRARKGRIVNLASVSGIAGNAGQANYAAAKAGVIGLTKTAAKELGSRGITVNAIAPGFVETDMTAGLPDAVQEEAKKRISLGRFGKAEEIAQLAAFLASDRASYITGQVIAADGGMAL